MCLPLICPSQRVDASDPPRHIFLVGQGARIYRFSINFLSFLGFFERVVWLENDALLAAP
jgi:hypothetical protein